MKPPAPSQKKEPLFRRSRKTATIVAAILFGAAIICVAAMVVMVQSQSGSEPGGSPVPTDSPPAAVPTMVRHYNTQPTPGSQPEPVDFTLVAGPQLSCGLTCRELTPAITNTGNQTAHNVCISLVVYNSGGDMIFLNGAPSLVQCVGNIAGGESKSSPIVINADCGIIATKCLGQVLILQTTVTSDEKTVQFPDQMIAV